MVELMQENVLLLVLALVIGIAVAWYVFAASRKTVVQRDTAPDEAAPAKRNQALIDAPASTKQADAAPQPAGSEQASAAPASMPAGSGVAPASAGDDLTRIKGVGSKLAVLLNELGVTSFAQIAAWDDAEIDRIDAQLDRFEGRIRRDSWVEQARMLAEGDTAAFAAKFGQV